MRQLALAACLATVMSLVIFAATVWISDDKPFESPIAQFQSLAPFHRGAIGKLPAGDPAPANIVSTVHHAVGATSRRRDQLWRY